MGRTKARVYRWKCGDCGKELWSNWEKQLENNKKFHKMTHQKVAFQKRGRPSKRRAVKTPESAN